MSEWLIKIVERRRHGGGEFLLTWARWENEPHTIASVTGAVVIGTRLVTREREQTLSYRDDAERDAIVWTFHVGIIR